MKIRYRAAAGVAIVAGALAASWIYSRSTRSQQAVSPAEKQGLLIAGVDDGYVDSAACSGCHRQIWDTYRKTGMGRSFARVKPEIVGGDFERNNTFYHSASDRYYTMFRKDGKYYQRRYEKGLDGKEDNAIEKEIHFVVGSGNHARTFLHRTPEGRLFELPVAWYSQDGGYWAMNPGFDHARQPDFRRQLVFECVSCHTAYPEIQSGADGSGQEPLFPGRIPEGIDCQRCHGPGRRHIQEATGNGKPESIRAAIVNPKRLAPARQLEVCMQCHLETTSSRLPHTILRFDRGAFSYRPGTPLADFAIHFDHQPGSGRDDKFEIAHQAYRLRKSACFTKSDRMTCTTCHDPHSAPRREEATQQYTSACRSCHVPKLEQLVQAGRHTGAPNCIGCHMPKRRPEDVVNVVMTDHYIQRRPPNRDPASPLKERHETEENSYKGEVVLYYPPELSARPEDQLYIAVAQVKQFNNLEKGIPRLEAALDRHPDAAAEFYFELAEAYGKINRLNEAIQRYRETLRKKPEFRPAWLGLGRSLGQTGESRESVEALEKAAGLGPEDATILNDLGLGYLAAQRTPDALRVLRRAVAVDPDHAEAHNNLAGALRESGDLAGAEQSYRAAVRAQPDFVSARQHLANLMAERGAFVEADHHFRKVLAQEPKSAVFRYQYATALAGVERYLEASRQFEEVTGLDPGMAEAHLGLADMLAMSGKIPAATGRYRKALALKPGLGAAHLGLASALVAQGREAEALVHLKSAAESSDATAAQAARQALAQIK